MRSSLTIRPATIEDRQVLWLLIDRLKEHYFEDCELEHGFTADMLLPLIDGGNLSVMSLSILDAEVIVGAVLLDEIHPAKLHGRFHTLVDPVYWRQISRQDGISKAIDYTFKTYGVRKIKAMPMKTQKSALKLLKKYGFWFGDAMPNEAMVKGKPVSVLPCHLTRGYWYKQKGQLNG